MLHFLEKKRLIFSSSSSLAKTKLPFSADSIFSDAVKEFQKPDQLDRQHMCITPFALTYTANINCLKYIKVQTATRWSIRHGLMPLWFTDLTNVTEEVTIHRPKVSTLLSSAFIRGDLNAAKRGPFI